MAFIPPTEKQRKYAHDISLALDDEADLESMDKWQMRNYISNVLSNPQTKKKFNDYTNMMMRREHEKQVAERIAERMADPSWRWKQEWQEQRRHSAVHKEIKDDPVIESIFGDEDYYGDRGIEPDVFG